MMDAFNLQLSQNESVKSLKYKLLPNSELYRRKCENIECFECIFSSFIKFKDKNIIEVLCPYQVSLSTEEIELFSLLRQLYFDFQKKYNRKRKIVRRNSNSEMFFFFKDPFSIHLFYEILNNKSTSNNRNQLKKKGKLHFEEIKTNRIQKTFQKVKKKSKISNYLKMNYAMLDWNLQTIKKLFFSLKHKENIKSVNWDQEDGKIIFKYSSFENLVDIIIFNDDYHRKKIRYEIKLNSSLLHKIEQILDFISLKIRNQDFSVSFSLSERIAETKNKIYNLIEAYYHSFSIEEKRKIAIILTLKFLKIETIFIFLQDEMIEEIFMDELNSPLYFNHQKFGRLESDIILTISEVEAIKTYVCLESRKRLDFEVPSIMHVFQSKYTYARVSLDVYPSHWKNISIDIRNLKKRQLTIFDLIELKTMNVDIATFILFLVFTGINITIAGEVNSGKTTLLNAIDLYVPLNYRKIYVEENIETLFNNDNNSHQLKYIVQPESLDRFGKQKQIYKLLHRSGDFIILGEVLSNLETHAMFHCFSAGLRGIQTTHASSIDGLINRWLYHYKINPSCLNDLGVIIFIKKVGNRRFIHSINQLVYYPGKNEVKRVKLYHYDIYKQDWEQDRDKIHNFFSNKYKLNFILKVESLQFIFKKIKQFFENSSNKSGNNINSINLNQIYRSINTSLSELQ